MKTINSSNSVKSSVLFAALAGALFIQLSASNVAKPAIAQTAITSSVDLNKKKGQTCYIQYTGPNPINIEEGVLVEASDVWIVIQKKEDGNMFEIWVAVDKVQKIDFAPINIATGKQAT